jgi:hypothetical protein
MANSAFTTGGESAIYDSGQSSRTNGAGIGNQDISHSLGVTPKLVKIFYSQAIGTNGSRGTGTGTALSTSVFSCTFMFGTNNTNIAGQDNTKIIYTDSTLGVDEGSATITVIDSTKFRLNWITAPSVEVYFQWEVYA